MVHNQWRVKGRKRFSQRSTTVQFRPAPDDQLPRLVLGLRPHGRFPFIVELTAGGSAVEFPVDLDAVAVYPSVPGFRLLAQVFEIRDSPSAQTLP